MEMRSVSIVIALVAGAEASRAPAPTFLRRDVKLGRLLDERK